MAAVAEILKNGKDKEQSAPSTAATPLFHTNIRGREYYN
jgi:hypothetical protein